jgi:hypothetical protein
MSGTWRDVELKWNVNRNNDRDHAACPSGTLDARRNSILEAPRPQSLTVPQVLHCCPWG